MEYYRKAAAVLLVFAVLFSTFFWKPAPKIAVVDINRLIKESKKIKLMTADSKEKKLRREVFRLTAEAAEKLAAENNYSSVITKHTLYKGGVDITAELAAEIDGR